jgi:hypothetical protein
VHFQNENIFFYLKTRTSLLRRFFKTRLGANSLGASQIRAHRRRQLRFEKLASGALVVNSVVLGLAPLVLKMRRT